MNLQISTYSYPVNDYITITIANQNVTQIFEELKDIVGCTFYSSKCTFYSKMSLDVSALKSGIYILEMMVNRERVVRKIVKE